MISEWKIKDQIKNGKIKFQEGDQVVVFRRKTNGYPKAINDEDDYFIKKIDRDFLIVAKHSLDGVGWMQPHRIHKFYFIPKYYLRDIKLNSLLDETN